MEKYDSASSEAFFYARDFDDSAWEYASVYKTPIIPL